jgi:SSS family solute:Na+ symporter
MLALFLVAAFIIAMIGLGVWGMGRIRTPTDFFLGGRQIGPWASAFAYGTSYFSAVVFIGFAGQFGWNYGLDALWIAAGNTVVGVLAAWVILAKPTRRMTRNLDALTMPEFFAKRYQAPVLRVVAAGIIFLFLLPYSASVFKGLSHLVEINFQDLLSYEAALFIMCVSTGLYLTLGGYFAVAIADLIQGLIMLAGAVVMVIVLVGQGGGFTAVIQAMSANVFVDVSLSPKPSWWILWSVVFMSSFGPWGLPQMVHKFYAIKSERHITTATIVATVFATVTVFAAYFTGALTRVFFADGLPASALTREQSGTVGVQYDVLVPELLTAQLPEVLMAVVLLLVLSASMSTLSSLVLVSSSAISVDLRAGRAGPEATPTQSLRIMRWMAAVFIAISFVIANNEFAFIVTLMSLSWGAVAGAFLAPYVYGLFWRSATGTAAFAGMLTGLGIAVVWGGYLVVSGRPELTPVAASVAMVVPFFVIPVVSMCSTPPSSDLLRDAFAEDSFIE